MSSLFITLAIGALSYAPGLHVAIDSRVAGRTEYNLDAATVENYSCYVGLPNQYTYLIGQEVWFKDSSTGRVYGPWLVVDVAQRKHAGQLADRGLAADVICDYVDMTHRHGEIGIRSRAQ